MAEIAVEYLVARLEDWIFKETNKHRAAQVTKLKAEFDRVKPFLKYADWKCLIMEDSVFETWVSHVINLAREVENVIDGEYYTRRDTREFSVSSLVGLLGESLNYFSEGKVKDYSHMSIANFLRRVKEKLKEVDIRKNIPLFSSMEDARGDRHTWYTESFTLKFPITRTVGREKEIRMLKEWLLKEQVDMPLLVAVTGISGIGKTAMSTTVFDCINIYFDCAAWVYVSARPIVDILRDMYMGFTRTSLEVVDYRYLDEMDIEELTKIIKHYLVGKKLLLVIDDLDTIDAWEYVKYALPLNFRGKVLMTTCNSVFPAILCKHVLHLEPLCHKESLQLMHWRISWQHSDLGEVLWPSTVELLREKILEICGGQPLLVATVAGLLSTVNIKEPNEWDNIHGMLKAAVEYLPHFNMSQKVLVASYFSLPPMLKCCLLYCGVYPSHYEISCKRLIRLWVAEGFIVRELLGMTEEEIGKHLLDDLIRRNLLEVARVGVNGEVVSCRLLRPVQHFILKTMNKDFYRIMSNKIHHISSKASHALVVHGRINNYVPDVNTTLIRSLLLFRESGIWTPSILLDSCSNIKFLRVLELQNSPINALPESVGNLVLLRYMNLRNTRIHNLPSSLKNLHELQTLDIRNTYVRALPSGTDNLKMLRHLLLADSFSNRAVKLDGDLMFLKDLQTLAGIKLTQQIAFGLTYLPQLLKLSVGEVEGRGTSVQLSKSINLMKNISSLTIRCAWRKEIEIQASNPLENLKKLRIEGWVRNLLGWVRMIKSIKYLYLQDCSLTEDPISSLQYLPSLTVLSLCNAYKGNKICCDDAMGFPNLKELSLLKFSSIEEWTRIEEGSMRSLERLIIAKCPQLKLPPQGLHYLTNLKLLQVKSMPAAFIKKTQELPLHTRLRISVVC